MNAPRNPHDLLRRSMILTLILAGFCLTGCATFTVGSNQRIPVSTSPPDALVQADGISYQSPCVLMLARARDHVVTISKEGYRSETRNIVRVPTSRVMGNIAIGGLIGLAVDAASGANNELAPGYIDVTLAPCEVTGDALAGRTDGCFARQR